MTTISKTIYSTKQYQLIDLNGDFINFKIDYILESTDAKPFKAGIVSQEQLDENSPIIYKDSENGKILGSIENENNTRGNYYIAIQSENETEINMNIIKNEIPLLKSEVDFKLKENNTSFIYKYGYIIFIIAICIGFAVYYYMYIYLPTPSVSDSPITIPEIEVKTIQPEVNIEIKEPLVPSLPEIDTKSYSPASSIHSVNSSENSSPVSERSDISDGCKNAINDLLSKCIDL